MSDFDKLAWANKVIKELLLPCPICGEAEVLTFRAPNSNGKEEVQCLNCGLSMEKALGNKKSAIAWWNTRPNLK